MNTFSVWRTIKLGTMKYRRDYLRAMDKASIWHDDCTSVILRSVTLSRSEAEVDLVVATPRELGFTENPSPKAL